MTTQQVGVASQQVGVAHPPGLPMPATNQQQLQHHVRQLLQEVSSSDHLSSSDNDDHKTNATVPTIQPAATHQMVNQQQYDTRNSPLLWLQAVSPKGIYPYIFSRALLRLTTVHGKFWQGEVLANHTGKSCWQGKKLDKLQSVHILHTFSVYL